MAGRTSYADGWHCVCRLVELEVDRGVSALVHGQALAIFRTQDGSVYALGNHDPFSRTAGIARGIVGRRGDAPFVGSPVHGRCFDLRSGRCLEDPHSAVPAYDVQVVDGMVLVGRRTSRHPGPA